TLSKQLEDNDRDERDRGDNDRPKLTPRHGMSFALATRVTRFLHQYLGLDRLHSAHGRDADWRNLQFHGDVARRHTHDPLASTGKLEWASIAEVAPVRGAHVRDVCAGPRAGELQYPRGREGEANSGPVTYRSQPHAVARPGLARDPRKAREGGQHRSRLHECRRGQRHLEIGPSGVEVAWRDGH